MLTIIETVSVIKSDGGDDHDDNADALVHKYGGDGVIEVNLMLYDDFDGDSDCNRNCDGDETIVSDYRYDNGRDGDCV